ncbi:MAG: hypothetical protein R8G66_05710 [Cytophagales bacterium]|nr:hypothetical protein [Cytophagales bacterium]
MEQLMVENIATVKWERYASHREKTSQLITALIRPEPVKSMAILGAGSGLDLELAQWQSLLDQITLIDINGQLLDDASAVHPLVDFSKVEQLGAIDFTGLYDRLDQPGTMNDWVAAAAKPTKITDRTFDLVVSDAVFSEMINMIHPSIPEGDLSMLIRTLRKKHLNDLLSLLNPGGVLVFITDLVSTASAPDLLQWPEDQLNLMMEKLLIDQNFFAGCNPYAIVNDCENDTALIENISRIELTKPWLWRVHDHQLNLVYALVMHKNPIEETS